MYVGLFRSDGSACAPMRPLFTIIFLTVHVVIVKGKKYAIPVPSEIA